MIGKNMSKIKKTFLKPQCLFKRGTHDQQICLNAAGYFTPCCWFDSEDAKEEDPRIAGFFDPSLNIKNYDDPKDIIEGKYWQKFFRRLLKDPENAPERCWNHCGSTLITNKMIDRDTRIAI